MFRVLQGATGFSPLDLGPDCWYDFSDSYSLRKAASGVMQPGDDSTDIVTVLDKSGNGYDLTDSGASASVFRSGTGAGAINGLSCAYFDGSADSSSPCYLEEATATQHWSNASGLTVVVVASASSARVNVGIVAQYHAGGARRLWGVYSDSVTCQDDRETYSANDSVSYTQPIAPVVVGLRWTPASNAKVYLDGVLDGSTPDTIADMSTDSLTKLRVGGAGDTANWYLGSVGEVVIIERNLTDSEFRSLSTHLQRKWGV